MIPKGSSAEHGSLLSLIQTIISSAASDCENGYEWQGFHIELLGKAGTSTMHLIDKVRSESAPYLLVQANKTTTQPHRTSSDKPTCSIGTPSSDTSTPRSMGTSDLDYSGCPLECPFDSIPEEDSTLEQAETIKPSNVATKVTRYNPLSPSSARYILSAYNRILTQHLHSLADPFEMWVLCDGTDAKKTVLLGQKKKGTRITNYMVTSKGYTSPAKLPSISSLKRDHLSTFIGSNQQVEMKAFAKYSIGSNGILNYSCAKEFGMQGGSITFDCWWNGVATVLQAPSSDAKCTMHVKVTPGRENTAMYPLYSDLKTLQNLLWGLETGEMNWVVKEADGTLMDKVKLLLTETLKRGMHNQASGDTGTENRKDQEGVQKQELDSSFEMIVCEKRKNLDFVDQLWDVLKEASSLDQLKRALQYLMEEVQTCTFKPLIGSRNKSAVGCWIKDVLTSEKALPRLPLDGIEPVKYLIEMGVQKLQRDYTDLFVRSELATQDGLKCFLCPNLVSSASLNALLNMHHTLEVATRCRELHFSQQMLVSFTREVLQYYSTAEPSPDHTFTFLLTVPKISHLLDSMKPIQWDVHLRSSQDTYHVHTHLMLSRDNQCPHIRNGKVSESDVKSGYFCLSSVAVNVSFS